jgi:predicted Zn-dependent peptidase
VLDEHLPLAIDILSDIVLNPAFSPDDIEREKKVVVEEIKMVEDTPDDLVHELFTQGFWENHPLGRPILGSRETVESFERRPAARLFPQRLHAAQPDRLRVGNLEHDACASWSRTEFGSLRSGRDAGEEAPTVVPKVLIRNKELEQSHLCLGASSYPQNHDDRYSSYVLNTLLGGSMSSRLFQNVREKARAGLRGVQRLSAYRDAGSFTVYAGCANEAVGEVIDLVVEELRAIKQAPVPDAELQRAKDHLKGSLMLSLENTASRMSHLARQEIYFDRQFGLDETLLGIERVTADEVQRVAVDPLQNDSLARRSWGT